MTDTPKEPFTSLASLLSRIDGELSGSTKVAMSLLTEARTAIVTLSQLLAHHDKALRDIALRGTHHDTCPTRVVASVDNAEAWKIDAWWLQYFHSADSTARAIAQKAVDGHTMANRYIDQEELHGALQVYLGDNGRHVEGIANQLMNIAMRRRIG